MNRHNLFWFVILMVVFLSAPAFVFAQEGGDSEVPPPPPPAFEFPTPEDVLFPAIGMLITAIVGLAATPGVSVITAIVKRLVRIPLLAKIPAVAGIYDLPSRDVNMLVASVLIGGGWIVYVITYRPVPVNGFLEWVMILAPAVLGTVGAFKGSEWIYIHITKGMPLLGTSRDGDDRLRPIG